MFTYKRRIQTNKTYEDVCEVLQSSSYCGDFKIENDHFSLRCSKRNQRGQIMLYRVSGQLIRGESTVDVIFEIHGGIEVLIAIGIFACSLINFLYLFLTHEIHDVGNSVFAFLIMIAFCFILCFFPLARGIEIIDLLEHKLTR